jgi:uncharacterized protein YegP (UPF0339 family)
MSNETTVGETPELITPAAEEIITPQTGHTDQPPPLQPGTRAPYFEMAQDEEGNWAWILWAPNGRPVAMNTNPFTHKHDAMKCIRDLCTKLSEKTKIITTNR